MSAGGGFAVPGYTADEAIRHADVKSAVAAAGEDVNVVSPVHVGCPPGWPAVAGHDSLG